MHLHHLYIHASHIKRCILQHTYIHIVERKASSRRFRKMSRRRRKKGPYRTGLTSLPDMATSPLAQLGDVTLGNVLLRSPATRNLVVHKLSVYLRRRDSDAEACLVNCCCYHKPVLSVCLLIRKLTKTTKCWSRSRLTTPSREIPKTHKYS